VERGERCAAPFAHPLSRGAWSRQRSASHGGGAPALEETDAERATLAKLASIDYEAADVNLRLMELSRPPRTGRGRAQRAPLPGNNPLVAPPWRYLAQATTNSVMPPPPSPRTARYSARSGHPGEVHFQLAQLLQRNRDPAARREVLLALEEAPRHRAALNLAVGY